jgi:hypothetical protein
LEDTRTDTEERQGPCPKHSKVYLNVFIFTVVTVMTTDTTGQILLLGQLLLPGQVLLVGQRLPL